MPYVYILKSVKDEKRYIGSTVDLDVRLNQHNEGSVFSTRNRRPLVLFAYRYFEAIGEAALYEKKYKNSSGMIERHIRSGLLILSNRGVV